MWPRVFYDCLSCNLSRNGTPKRFWSYRALLEHRKRIHPDIEIFFFKGKDGVRYQCGLCNALFGSRQEIDQHRKLFHPPLSPYRDPPQPTIGTVTRVGSGYIVTVTNVTSISSESFWSSTTPPPMQTDDEYQEFQRWKAERKKEKEQPQRDIAVKPQRLIEV